MSIRTKSIGIVLLMLISSLSHIMINTEWSELKDDSSMRVTQDQTIIVGSETTINTQFASNILSAATSIETSSTIPGMTFSGMGAPIANTATAVEIANTWFGLCTLYSNNSIHCAGKNSYGQFAIGSTSTTSGFSTWSNIPTGKTIESIDGASGILCALMTDGTAYCAGLGSNGLLGNGQTTDSSSFVQVTVPTGRTIDSFKMTANTACALLDNNELYCWGVNSWGQLGIGNTQTPKSTPQKVSLPTGRTVLNYSVGQYSACAVLDNYDVYCWGHNGYSRLGIGLTNNNIYSSPQQVTMPNSADALAIYQNDNTVCSVLRNQSAYCWGTPHAGARFTGDSGASIVNSPTYAPNFPLLSDIKDFSLFSNGNACVQYISNDTVNCLGENGYYLMDKNAHTYDHVYNLTELNGLDGYTITGFSAQRVMLMVTLDDGTHRVSGFGNYDALNQGTTSSSTFAYWTYPTSVYSVSAKGSWTGTPTTPGTYQVTEWANTSSGSTQHSYQVFVKVAADYSTQTTTFSSGDSVSITPTVNGGPYTYSISPDLPGGLSFSTSTGAITGSLTGDYDWTNDYTITASSSTTTSTVDLTLTMDNPHTYKDWYNGLSQSQSINLPTDVLRGQSIVEYDGLPSGITYNQHILNEDPYIQTTYDHACMINSTQEVVCWGNDYYWRLGGNKASESVGTEEYTPFAPNISATGNPIDIAMTATTTCILYDDQTLYCAGYNSEGELGLGDTNPRKVFTNITSAIPTGKTIDRILTSKTASNVFCFTTTDDLLYCAGNNHEQQIFNSTTLTEATTFTQVYIPDDFHSNLEIGPWNICYINTSGVIKCRGYGGYGITDGTTTTASEHTSFFSITSPIPSGRTVTQFGIGYLYYCALLDNNDVTCWGINDGGQMGSGTTSASGVYSSGHTQTFNSTHYPTEIFVGDFATCYRLNTDEFYCWGSNNYGGLGVGDSTNTVINTATKMNWSDHSAINDLEMAWQQGCATMKVTGELYCWGINGGGFVGTGDSSTTAYYSPVSITGGHTVFEDYTAPTVSGVLLDTVGNHEFTVWANSTSGSYSQTFSVNVSNPVEYADSYTRTNFQSWNFAPTMANGSYTLSLSPALPSGLSFNSTNGAITGSLSWIIDWQNDFNVTIDTGSATLYEEFTLYFNTAYPDLSVTAVKDKDFSLNLTGLSSYLTQADTIEYDGLPSGLDFEQSFAVEPGIKNLDVGSGDACIIDDNFEVWCWGRNPSGELGLGNNTAYIYEPVKVSLSISDKPLVIASGEEHRCILFENNKVQCTGKNLDGQLGLGDLTNRNTFTNVTIPTGKVVENLHANGYITCLEMNDESIYCTGDNNYKVISSSTTTDISSFTLVSTPSDSAEIFLGFFNICVVDTSGNVYCNGNDGFGAFDTSSVTSGTSTNSFAQVTTPIPSGRTVVSMQRSHKTSCALLDNGDLRCWGDNAHRQISSSSNNWEIDTTISGSTYNITDYVVSYYGICATVDTGDVICRGRNQQGQLGVGNTTDPISTLTTQNWGTVTPEFVSISGEMGCGYGSDNIVKCWGNDATGSSGNGNTTGTTNSPVAITGNHSLPDYPYYAYVNGTPTTTQDYDTVTIWANSSLGTFTINTNVRVVEGVSYVDQTFGDGDTLSVSPTENGGPYTYSISPALPAGLSFNTSSGEISGSLSWGNDWEGEFNVTYTDGASYNGYQMLTLTYSASSTTPSFTLLNGFHGEVATKDLFGGTIVNDATSINASGVPSGMSFSGGGSFQSTILGSIWGQTCGVAANQSLMCWGSSSNGELGNGQTSTNSVNTPVKVLLPSNVTATQVVGHYLFGCALTDVGDVYCWGKNDQGVIGNDGVEDQIYSTPQWVHLPVGRTATQIVSDSREMCALLDNGSVTCWGKGSHRIWGDGTSTNRYVPDYVTIPTGRTVDKIGLSDYTLCMILDNSSVYCTGYGGYGNKGDGGVAGYFDPAYVLTEGDVVDIKSDYRGHIIEYSDGQLAGWGDDYMGFFPASITSDQNKPVNLTHLPNTGLLDDWQYNEQLTCVIYSSNKSMQCLGGDVWGERGDGSSVSGTIKTLTPYLLPTGAQVQSMFVGWRESCAILTNQTLYCAGGFGLGVSNAKTPTAVNFGTYNGLDAALFYGTPNATQSETSYTVWANTSSSTASATVNVTVVDALSMDIDTVLGSVNSPVSVTVNSLCTWCTYSVSPSLPSGLSIDSSTGAISGTPTATSTTTTYTINASASNGSAEITFDMSISSNTAKTMYVGFSEEFSTGLSNGDITNATSFEWASEIAGISNSGSGVSVDSKMTAGQDFFCGIQTNGSIICWGKNAQGEFGTGTTGGYYSVYHTPEYTALPAGETPVAITSGADHVCALMESADVYCWGYGSYGMLGIGSTSTKNSPQHVSTLSDVVQIDAGFQRTCALLENNSVYCWGSSMNGLMFGTTSSVTLPVHVPTPAGKTIATIEFGYASFCLIMTDGTAWCKSYNSYGQIGQGHTNQVGTFTQINPNGTTVTSIGESARVLCYSLSNGTAYCSGNGYSGTLGNGANSDTTTFVQVSMPSNVSVRTVSNGYNYAHCADTTDGDVYCWGSSGYGLLGTRTSNSNVPVWIDMGGEEVVHLYSTSADEMFAITNTSKLLTWGNNIGGMAGQGHTSKITTPTAITHMSVPASVAPSLWYGTPSTPGTGTITAWANNTTSGESLSAAFDVTVYDAFHYATTSLSLTKNQSMTSISPTINLSGLTYTATGLPAGVSIDASTGQISGMPTEVISGTITVTGSNSDGAGTFQIALVVAEILPALTINPSSYTLYTGEVATSIIPVNTGGTATSWSVSPALPAGLTLDTSNGVISGTPTANQTLVNYTLSAVNSAGTTNLVIGITILESAPDISYNPDAVILTVGQAMTAMTPINSGGKALMWEVSPALPNGLSMDTYGVITGTPTANQTHLGYTVWANNSQGSNSTTIYITVSENAAVISYSPASVTLTRGVAMTTASATNTGGQADFWEISPALPAGLSFADGDISGTPTVNMTTTNFTIWANNSGGSGSTTFTITINEPIADVSYSPSSATLIVGDAMTAMSPSNSAGAVATWEVDPALPSGVSMDSYGVISGTPTANMSATTYTIWANNSGGSNSTTITLTILESPADISYSPSSFTLTRGVQMTDASPTNVGGVASSWAISPALPAGLTFNNGVISGTATVNLTQTTYTIWANNTAGSNSTTIDITINEPVANISYNPSSLTLFRNSAMTDATPTVTGGAVSSWEISPALPAGLTFSNGVISGTPTVASASTTYTIWANNTGGSASTTITILVNDIAANISYSPSSVVGEVGATITSMTMTNNGGVWDTLEITPSLPAGLTMSSNGLISGTPGVNMSQTTFTIWANNSAASVSTTVTITINEPLAVVQYSPSSEVGTRGEVFSDMTPTTSGGNVATWEISPALPAGLSMDSYGVISGTPTVNSTLTTYTIYANNTGGSITVTVDIEVYEPIAEISYNPENQTGTRGIAIIDMAANNSGGMVGAWGISPALPAGLVFADGVISGTPTVNMSETTFTIYANNSGGIAQTTINLTILEPAPVLSWLGTNTTEVDEESFVVLTGEEFEFWAENTGGNVANWEVYWVNGYEEEVGFDNPLHPEQMSGVVFRNGMLSGIPTTALGFAQGYGFYGWANNTGGSVYFEFAFVQVDPVDIEPEVTYYNLTEGDNFTTFLPSSEAYNATIYSITPDLPAGLTFDPFTGQINGTVEEDIPLTEFTITAASSIDPAMVMGDAASLQENILWYGHDNISVWISVVADTDRDGWIDIVDDFPEDPAEWIDTDADGTGNNADLDDDGDNWTDVEEADCSTDSLDATSIPEDYDGDHICNIHDEDDDNDDWTDLVEINCSSDPLNGTVFPIDTDGDGECDYNDEDDDNDGRVDVDDAFPLDPEEQDDTDSDGIGNNADDDDDNDSWTDLAELSCGTDRLDDGDIPADNDGDRQCDPVDPDDDNDTWSDNSELECGTDSMDDSSVPADNDGDSTCDVNDDDDDNDSYTDLLEMACDSDEFDAESTPLDNDGDGECDKMDTDDDNDGVLDLNDAFPFDETEDSDFDGDGIGDNSDNDVDGDGIDASLDQDDRNPAVGEESNLLLYLAVGVLLVIVGLILISGKGEDDDILDDEDDFVAAPVSEKPDISEEE